MLKIYGNPDEKTREQMEAAMALPISQRGALMPDAHLGYGLPIGGVLETRGAVIPYAVGVDIGCRVMLSMVRAEEWGPGEEFGLRIAKDAILSETAFGPGSGFELDERRDHPIMDDDRWELIPFEKDEAHRQLGSSGGGNHFVDFGRATVGGVDFVAFLTHSGSRGAGARTCEKFSAIAKEENPEGGDLAWLEFGPDRSAASDYWAAMQLMGDYALANHEVIHSRLWEALGMEPSATITNAHNLAWRVDGDRYVHRKGATPAGSGQLGVIPGTMDSPAYIVEGRGCVDSIHSSAHGAGRRMGRRQAKRELDGDAIRAGLSIDLIGGDTDELPPAYKDIDEVMAAQSDTCWTIGVFRPQIVRMA